MREETIAIATRFVDLALKYRPWVGGRLLSSDEVDIFVDILTVAGFRPATVNPGKKRGHYLDQDGGRTGDTYPINETCPYYVVGQDGEPDYAATGWLDCALSAAISGRGKDYADIVAGIAHEIERSVPLEPIQLNTDGDFLLESAPRSHGFGNSADKHARDEDALRSSVGVHQECCGFMDFVTAAKFKDAIVCRHCHLRVSIPKGLKTYGELREALASQVSVPV